jgi:hypothetical protein
MCSMKYWQNVYHTTLLKWSSSQCLLLTKTIFPMTGILPHTRKWTLYFQFPFLFWQPGSSEQMSVLTYKN